MKIGSHVFATAAALLLAGAPLVHAGITIKPGPVDGVKVFKEPARGSVWCEIIPFVGTPPNVLAHIYTSTGVDNCTEERTAKLDAVKWDMLEEWSRTRKAPQHAAWMHPQNH